VEHVSAALTRRSASRAAHGVARHLGEAARLLQARRRVGLHDLPTAIYGLTFSLWHGLAVLNESLPEKMFCMVIAVLLAVISGKNEMYDIGI